MENNEYKLICEYAFGGIILDIEWAKNTLVYKQTKKILINQGKIGK